MKLARKSEEKFIRKHLSHAQWGPGTSILSLRLGFGGFIFKHHYRKEEKMKEVLFPCVSFHIFKCCLWEIQALALFCNETVSGLHCTGTVCDDKSGFYPVFVPWEESALEQMILGFRPERTLYTMQMHEAPCETAPSAPFTLSFRNPETVWASWYIWFLRVGNFPGVEILSFIVQNMIAVDVLIPTKQGNINSVIRGISKSKKYEEPV